MRAGFEGLKSYDTRSNRTGLGIAAGVLSLASILSSCTTDSVAPQEHGPTTAATNTNSGGGSTTSSTSRETTTSTTANVSMGSGIQLVPTSGDCATYNLFHPSETFPCTLPIYVSPYVAPPDRYAPVVYLQDRWDWINLNKQIAGISYLSANGHYSKLPWPNTSSSWVNWPGNPVTVECYITDGYKLTSEGGANVSSSDWYEIFVPDNHIVNTQIATEVQEGKSPVPIAFVNGQEGVLGWSDVIWFDNASPTPAAGVPHCAKG